MQLSPQHWMSASARRVLDAVAAAGGEARYVGGCVRDAVLGREGGDVDMACTLPPEQTMQALAAAGIRAIPTGLAHGTVTAICDHIPYEITTLRRDVASDGRHAEVAFTGDWREDAARRDFTMNALYADRDGKVYDYFDGLADARTGRLRFIGQAEQRIAEDGLRILRFFRFFAHYGNWPMDGAALRACEAKKAMLQGLSGERIQAEMFKLLAARKAADVLVEMLERGILHEIGLPRANLPLLRQLESADPLLRLAALLRGGDTEALLHRWKLSNAQKARLRALAAPALEADWDEWEQKKALRQLGAERFTDQTELALAADPAHKTAYAQMRQLAQTWEIPAFPVSGQDLLAAGVPQGKELGNTLKRLETAWEEAHYTLGKEALLRRL